MLDVKYNFLIFHSKIKEIGQRNVKITVGYICELDFQSASFFSLNYGPGY